ncbi:cellulose synthase regulator BcsB [Bordetella genomosp. 8]|uniref:Cyclic di-GMP-binding protein n=1 Tax=Bordetella genomosp. 8 TaxID=1416806 RepID=A0A1W6YEC5_9BORD|nr:cellulose biosynthesis cyclic di-GMP-binding regulatory protein BcsB [Bordetella genomosp. 8]ARP79411.1 cellulose synthase regulator BcsB [Bordetella genomosp. 8]
MTVFLHRIHRARRGLCGTLAGTLLASAFHTAGAAPVGAPPDAAMSAASSGAQPGNTAGGASAPAADGSRTYALTLRQLGAQYPLNITGIDGSNGVPFSVRADEVVTGAKLKLDYAYSPALLPDLSHINVMVNGEVAYSIPVPKEDGGKSLQRTVDIPPRLITDFNRLNLQLIGHYTMQCEDPLHSSLWANIGNQSVLELTVAPLRMRNDLSTLPLPFFDRRDVRRLVLPMVFAGNPDSGTLEAAGALSSWFGALADYRGARFPASIGQLPKEGNAVVLIAGGTTVPGLQSAGAAPAAVNGPTISVVTNPNDPNGKLLVIQGRDSADLKTAANALALGSQTMSGATATITKLQPLEPRKPYDAPNWLPSDRAVKFGELAEGRALNVAGYRPDLIRVNLRLPPDLFAWRDKRVPVDLKYRYTPRPTSDKSVLSVSLNDQFVQGIPLPAAKAPSLADKLVSDTTLPAEKRLELPLFLLPPRSQLQLYYSYDVLKQGDCKDALLDNVRGAIDPDSTIDISQLPHFIAMPDLAAFDKAGFPFTRMADLSQTTVVLPDQPAVSDYSAYLTLLGRLGASTGYPATGVTVSQPGQSGKLADKDLLVIASGDNQPLLKQWAQYMPASVDGKDKRFSLSDLVYKTSAWLGTPEQPRDLVAFSSDSADAMLAGFESPLTAGRSVVVVSGNKPQGLADALDVLLDDSSSDHGIKGSLAMVRGKQVESLLAQENYYVGELGPVEYAEWFFSRHLFVFLACCLLGALLLAAVLYWSLHARAQRRLKQ